MRTKKQRKEANRWRLIGLKLVKGLKRTKGFKTPPMPRWRTVRKVCSAKPTTQEFYDIITHEEQ